VLKSIWLDGKRNRRVDHLIHMLMMEYHPDLEIRHKRQTLGMEGPNLADERRRQILRRAPETPVTKIQKIDDFRFEVQSSRSLECHQIDLSTITCNCSDFPRISLCKHIAAVVHFFGGADLGPRPPGNAGASASESVAVAPSSPVQQDGSVGCADDGATASVISAANDMISLSQRLILKPPCDPRFAKSLNLFRSKFNALVLSATAAGDGSLDFLDSLPEKENFGPNQRSWPETASRMGVKRGNKCREKGKVDSALTAQHIGEPNRKRAADDDPYGAGEQSGKRAKPDARSAAANARARAAAERASLPKAEPPPTQLPLSPTLPPPTPLPPPASFPPPTPLPPASLPLPAPPPHALSPPYPPYYFHPPPAPLSQPMYSHSHHSHYQPHVYYQSQGAAPSAPYYHTFPT
jgi:hypothetical protein